MPQEIFLLVGVPASGKTWVLDRSKAHYKCIYHDDYIRAESAYLNAIIAAAATGNKPVLIEAPFSMSRIMEPLIDRGFVVKPIFIIEKDDVLLERYRQRNQSGQSVICGHLSRQKTFQSRVGQYSAFCGPSSSVLNHLNLLAAERGPNDGQ